MFVSSCHTWRRHCCEIGSFHAHECSAGSVDETELHVVLTAAQVSGLCWRVETVMTTPSIFRGDSKETVWFKDVSVETSDPVHDIILFSPAPPTEPHMYRTSWWHDLYLTWQDFYFPVMKEERKQETFRFNQLELQLWSELCLDALRIEFLVSRSWRVLNSPADRSVPGGGGGWASPHPEDVQHQRRRAEHLPPAGGQQPGLVLPAGGGGVGSKEWGLQSSLWKETLRHKRFGNLRSWKMVNPGCVFVHVQVWGCRQSWTTWRAGECVL